MAKRLRQSESLFELAHQAATRDAGKKAARSPAPVALVAPRADLTAVDGHRINDAHAWGDVMSEMRAIQDEEEAIRWVGLTRDEKFVEIAEAVPFFEAALDELTALPRTTLTGALMIAVRLKINTFLEAADSDESPFVL